MSLRFEPTADDPSRGAFLYGPIVLAADLGAEGLDAKARYGPSAPEVRLEELPPSPVLVAASPSGALSRVKPAAAPLTFRTEGIGRPADVLLRPFFRLSDRRYAVYFDVLTEAAWSEWGAGKRPRRGRLRRSRSAPWTVSRRASRRPRRRETSSGKGSDAWSLEGRPCRSARYGGTFTYSLRLPREGPAALRVAYWGGDSRRHVFEVVAEGETIATQSLFDDRPGEVLEVEYPLPERLARGEERLRVGFRTEPAPRPARCSTCGSCVRPAQFPDQDLDPLVDPSTHGHNHT